MEVCNVLRLIGQNAMLGPDAPVRHRAKRRRLRTVLQEIMNVAAVLSHHARRLRLRFGRHGSAYTGFERLYHPWATPG